VKSQLHSHALAIAPARSSSDSIMDGAVQFRKWLAIAAAGPVNCGLPRGENYTRLAK
jgi:hypothetical protein